MNATFEKKLLHRIRQCRVSTLAHKAQMVGQPYYPEEYIDEIVQCDVILAYLLYIEVEVSGGGVSSSGVNGDDYPF